jgi:hypothetical protein
VYLLDETRAMEDVVGGEYFVYPPGIPLSENLVEPPADQGLVFFNHRHIVLRPPTTSAGPAAELLALLAKHHVFIKRGL